MRIYWQFKNGSIGFSPAWVIADMILDGVKTRHCWDRSLGAYVYYER